VGQLSAGQVQQLRRYLEHMLEVNKSMNLTGNG
jgi:16S rRNA G527 N7-methylase RsmG